jgi:hypothetical protein
MPRETYREKAYGGEESGEVTKYEFRHRPQQRSAVFLGSIEMSVDASGDFIFEL